MLIFLQAEIMRAKVISAWPLKSDLKRKAWFEDGTALFSRYSGTDVVALSSILLFCLCTPSRVNLRMQKYSRSEVRLCAEASVATGTIFPQPPSDS